MIDPLALGTILAQLRTYDVEQFRDGELVIVMRPRDFSAPASTPTTTPELPASSTDSLPDEDDEPTWEDPV